MALSTEIVGDATITKVVKLPKEEAIKAPAGYVRFLIEARITALIRGPVGQSSAVRFLADVPLDAKGKPPKLNKQRSLVFASRANADGSDLRLLDRYALPAWTPDLDQRVRSIVTEDIAQGAIPPITGIGQVFSVAGSITGENETQIFINTRSDGRSEIGNGNRPISLSIIRRPGMKPRWNVALDEIVDEAAPDPTPNSLTWYRLACFLPKQLPPAAMDGMEAPMRRIAIEDYTLVVQQLGPCVRNIMRTTASNHP